MIRTTFLALGILLATTGCGAKEDARQDAASNAAAPVGADEVEALPSDGLAAPEGMTLDSESDDGAGGANAVGSAGGGNAT